MSRVLCLLAVLVTETVVCADCADTTSGGELLFILDTSNSMRDEVMNGETKWTLVRRAMIELAPDLASQNTSVDLFPRDQSCGGGEVVLEFGGHDAAAFAEALPETLPHGQRPSPIAEALDELRQRAQVPSKIVVVTDGWQWCDPHFPDHRFAMVSATDSLAKRGAVVSFIAVGTGVDVLALGRASNVGGAARPNCNPELRSLQEEGLCFEHAQTEEELVAALLSASGARLVAESCSGSREACDGVDNDLDGVVDEGCACVEGDLRPCGAACGEQRCLNASWTACYDKPCPTTSEADLCDGGPCAVARSEGDGGTTPRPNRVTGAGCQCGTAKAMLSDLLSVVVTLFALTRKRFRPRNTAL